MLQLCPQLGLDVIFFFNDTATTEIYTLSLHDALPIWCSQSWCGAMRNCSHEARDFLSGRAVRARPALAAAPDGVRSHPPLLRPLLSGVGAGTGRDGGRVAGRGGKLPARRMGGRVAAGLRG